MIFVCLFGSRSLFSHLSGGEDLGVRLDELAVDVEGDGRGGVRGGGGGGDDGEGR